MTPEVWLFLGSVLMFAGTLYTAWTNIRAVREKIASESKRVISEREKLQAESDDIEERITNTVLARAEQEINKYKAENELLKKKYDTLKAEHEILKGEYGTLKTEHEKLKAEYDAMIKRQEYFMSEVRNYHALITKAFIESGKTPPPMPDTSPLRKKK